LFFFPLRATCFKAFIASFTASMLGVDEDNAVKMMGSNAESGSMAIGVNGEVI